MQPIIHIICNACGTVDTRTNILGLNQKFCRHCGYQGTLRMQEARASLRIE